MNGRLAWFVAGTAAGAYSTLKARRAAYRMTPPGMADQANALVSGAREFGAQMRAGMRTRQAEIAADLDLFESPLDQTDDYTDDYTDKEYR